MRRRLEERTINDLAESCSRDAGESRRGWERWLEEEMASEGALGLLRLPTSRTDPLPQRVLPTLARLSAKRERE